MRGYRQFSNKKENLKITNKFSKQIFSLPMYPELSHQKLEKVIKILNNF